MTTLSQSLVSPSFKDKLMIKVTRRDGESGERLLKRFSGHIKSTRLVQKFRGLRYFAQKPTQTKVRQTAISREKYRAVAKRKQFLG